MVGLLLISDPRVQAVPIVECGEALVDLRTIRELRIDLRKADAAGVYAHLRTGVATRLLTAQRLLPDGLKLLVIEGYRPLERQRRHFDQDVDALRHANPVGSEEELNREPSWYAWPPDIAPHRSGAAVDLTLCTTAGHELPMGTAVNARPEESNGACYMAAPTCSDEGRANRRILRVALEAAGLVNYPTQWWHWSYGDRYWAVMTGQRTALYGPDTCL